MASRRPLVVVAGAIVQLPAGDTIEGADAAGNLAPATVSASGTTVLTRASHGNREVLCGSGSAMVMQIANDLAGGWQDGDFIIITRMSTGAVTVSGGSGVTVNKASAYQLSVRYQYVSVVARRTAANTWLVTGSLAL